MAKYRKYSKEFKLQAAKLVTEQGYSYDKAAKMIVADHKAESQPKIDEIRQLRKDLA